MRIGRIVAVIGLGAMGALWYCKRSEDQSTQPLKWERLSSKENEAAQGLRIAWSRSSDENRERKNSFHRDATTPSDEPNQIESSQKSSSVQFKVSVKELIENQFRLQGLDTNRQRIVELARSDEAVMLSVRILNDVAWARKEYGDDQAAGRVFAIKVLGERARQGDLRPLTDVATHLGADFNRLDQGQRADLRDVLTELIQVVGAKRFFADPSTVMQLFSNPGEVRKTVIAASVAHLGESINDPDFIRRMSRWR
jgi:hypothetical protein